MVAEYDKEKFVIEDLYDIYIEDYLNYCREYDRESEYFDADDDLRETPDQYRDNLFCGLERGQRNVLVRYSGHDSKVKIPDGVTAIKPYVFSKKDFIRAVYIPDSVESIGINAFDGCTSLETVSLGKNVKTIGWNAFARCTSLKRIMLPDSLEKIDQAMFYNGALEEIYIPKNVSFIGSGAFSCCKHLKKIEVDPENPNYTSRDNCVYDGKRLIVARNDGTLPNDGSFTSIGEEAFDSNPSVEEVVVPNGVTGIGIAAFRHCENLRRVTLPDTLEYIERCAFEGCAALEEIAIPGGVKSIDGLAFWNSGLKRVVIKHGVERIDDNAFGKCHNLCEIYIPSTVKKAFAPVGYKYECPDRKLRVYLEKSDERFYESWLDCIKDYEVITDFESDIFDWKPNVTGFN